MLRTAICSGHNCIDELRTAWQELVDTSPNATPFQTWEWQSTWLNRIGSGVPRVITVHAEVPARESAQAGGPDAADRGQVTVSRVTRARPGQTKTAPAGLENYSAL